MDIYTKLIVCFILGIVVLAVVGIGKTNVELWTKVK